LTLSLIAAADANADRLAIKTLSDNQINFADVGYFKQEANDSLRC